MQSELTLKISVFGVVGSPLQANRIVDHLVNTGFDRQDITVLRHDTVLLDMGVSNNDAQQYQARVKSGQALVSLFASEEREAEAACRIFQALGAEDVTVSGKMKEWREPTDRFQTTTEFASIRG